MLQYEKLTRAELIRQLRSLEALPDAGTGELRRLVYELQVQQVELETQNRELREAQQALEESRNRYADFYDFSPAAYVTLTDEGLIAEINLTAARLLGQFRTLLPGKAFVTFVARPDAVKFLHHLHQCRQAETGVIAELTLATAGRTVQVQLTTIRANQSEGHLFRTVIIDLSERKQREADLERTNEQLRELSSRLHSAIEQERARIAREIHDELGAMLTAIKMDLSWCAKTMANAADFPVEKVAALIQSVDAAIQTVRKIATDLRPSLLDTMGLWAAIEWQAQQMQEKLGIPCEVEISGRELTLEQDLATAVFRIVQEALTNIARHAAASKIRVTVATGPAELLLEVKDNGRGITPAQILDQKAWGLLGMQERARTFGGKITISGMPGKGTRVSLHVPSKGQP